VVDEQRWQHMRWQHLLEVARAADPDDNRNRIRDALQRKDTQALVDLAASYGAAAPGQQPAEDGEQLASLSVQTVQFFSEVLGMAGAYEAELALLWQAQKLHPSDYWLNFNLAVCLHAAGEVDAAIRFYTAALALQPDRAVLYASLGPALADKGAYD